MGGVCWWYSWTCRPVWPVFLLLAAVPVMLHSSESPATAVGKMYPRGNQWAVGHLMGKKSIESLPELRDANQATDYLTPSETARLAALDRFRRHERPLEALLQAENQKPTTTLSADRPLWLHSSSWRGRDRGKQFREISDLLLLALKLQDNDSS